MQDSFDTTKLHPLQEGRTATADEILAHVYRALQAKGYDPITQLVGYILTGDPTYITSYENARTGQGPGSRCHDGPAPHIRGSISRTAA